MTKVHLVGIGGSGMSAIARVLLESGETVSGSDRLSSPMTEALRAAGVRLSIGHAAENVQGADVVVRSSAVPDDNPEVVAARAAGIPVLKRAEFLGQLMKNRQVVAIAGTHGKTTTTAMTAWMLVSAGKAPSFIIGGVLKNLNTNAHAGRGDTFVIEADEYDSMFLGLAPSVAVITNIDYDHPDYYPTPAAYQKAFVDFTGKLIPGGWLLLCHDDPGALNLYQRLAENAAFPGSLASYGLSSAPKEASYYQASQLTPSAAGGFSFTATYQAGAGQPESLAQVSLQVPGEHNVRNALAALAVGHHLGLPVAQAAGALSAYQGSARRFDIAGEQQGIVLINDYAHHPTEISATLAAARARYPGRRIWAVWQPHTYSRTRAMTAGFAAAFEAADQVVITEIYAAREPAGAAVSAASLVAGMTHPGVHFIPTLEEVTSYLLAHLAPGDVVLVLSAGDADQVNRDLLTGLQQREER